MLRNKINPTGWIAKAPNSHGAGIKLYCFSYAGGSASHFLPWQPALHGAQICALQLPGRGARMMEQPFTSFPELIAALGEVMAVQERQPFAFFGHSLGALIAFELARYCKSHYLPMPQRLIVSGCNGPQALNPPRKLHLLPDEEFIAELRNYNGTPPEVLEHRELMELVLPIIRADFSLVDSYRYHPLGKLDIPILALAGRRDSYNSDEQVQAWEKESTHQFRAQWFEGDHFFINDERDDVLRTINRELAAMQGERQ